VSWAVRPPVIAAAGSIVVTVALVGAGVALQSPAPSSPPPPVSLGAPLASVDTATMAVARAPFCDRVPAADLTAALGTAPTAASSTSPGKASPVRRQVADEDGCAWSAGSATAAAWVFAPPVTVAWSRELTGVPHGCTPLTGVTYGSPSTAYACDGVSTLAGLFGDAWLTCTLASTDVEAVGRWCVAVARAAG
jgi:hypothetical protein